MRIPNNFVEISIKRNRLNKKVVNVEIKSVPLYDSDQWKYTKLDTVFTASLVDYSKIVASVKFIKQEDLYNNLSLLGIDGYNTTLSFGDSSNSITYSIFGPTYDTVERKLVPFLKTCELILAYAGLNIEDIFEKHVDKKKYSN
ncbi:hypothetical protein [Flavicella sediminum]|uniref:hypothetical protein n=1 Tax=Flavicella sediminum TaxID=2585141 RepID=UPI0011219757|nr:hypothetical protein [Flavicella sediminum]